MGRERKGKKRAGRRSTSRIKKLINKEEEFSRRPALEPPFGLHPLRRLSHPPRFCECPRGHLLLRRAPDESSRETEKLERGGGDLGNWRFVRSIASSSPAIGFVLPHPAPLPILKHSNETRGRGLKGGKEERRRGGNAIVPNLEEP